MTNTFAHDVRTLLRTKVTTARELLEFLNGLDELDYGLSDVDLNFEQIALVEETLSDGSKIQSLAIG